MNEKEIYTVVKECFGANALLAPIPLITYHAEDLPKPYIFCEIFKAGMLRLSIESAYKGVAEVATICQEIEDMILGTTHELETARYVFKERESEKNSVLLYKVKRFKTGE
jgi:hypothetical protein